MLAPTKFNENKKLNGNKKRLKQNHSETHHTILGGGRKRNHHHPYSTSGYPVLIIWNAVSGALKLQSFLPGA